MTRQPTIGPAVGTAKPFRWSGRRYGRGLSPCQVRQDSCRRDWVRFAIFFIDIGRRQLDEHSRPPFLVRGRRQGWRAAIAASRQSARLDPIPPRGVLHDIRILRTKKSWLTGQERQRLPGVASLAAPRNLSNITGEF